VLEVEEDLVEAAVADLAENMISRSGLQVVRVAGGYQMCTRPEFSKYCSKLLHPSNQKLSRAALETLAVVAYRQPVTQPEIEAIRGVAVDGVMKTLAERGLIKEVGRKPTVGRPMLFATTPEFLQYFGLNDLSELPDIDALAIEEVKALEAQKSLFENPEGVSPETDSSTADTDERP
jgi:segregation and condensation protein B